MKKYTISDVTEDFNLERCSSWIHNSQNELFEPTITSFKNAIVVNYKKAGTRFFNSISSFPDKNDRKKYQIDFKFLTNPNEDYYPTSLLGGGFMLDPFIGNAQYTNTIWKNLDNFFEYHNCKGWDDFLFRNEKDIIFVVRNPVKRFFSGLSQIFAMFVNEDIKKDSERKHLIQNSGPDFFTHEQVRKIMRCFWSGHPGSNDTIKDPEIDALYAKVVHYILHHRWDLILQDVHTENYLLAFIDWIDRIENKNKIKIINLDECKTGNSFLFFDSLRGDDLVSTILFFDKDNLIDSNTNIYNKTLERLEKCDKTFFWIKYLKNEINLYINLLNSKYFVDLNDRII